MGIPPSTGAPSLNNALRTTAFEEALSTPSKIAMGCSSQPLMMTRKYLPKPRRDVRNVDTGMGDVRDERDLCNQCLKGISGAGIGVMYGDWCGDLW